MVSHEIKTKVAWTLILYILNNLYYNRGNSYLYRQALARLSGLFSEFLRFLVCHATQIFLGKNPSYENQQLICMQIPVIFTSGPASPTLPRTPGGPIGPRGPAFPSLPEGPTGPGGPYKE